MQFGCYNKGPSGKIYWASKIQDIKVIVKIAPKVVQNIIISVFLHSKITLDICRRFRNAARELFFVNKAMGVLVLIFWYAAMYSTLLVTVNRFCSITKPLTYAKIFKKRNTTTLLVICWTIATCHGVVCTVGNDFEPSTF